MDVPAEPDAPVIVREVTLRRSHAWPEHVGCEDGRVAAGTGYWSGGSHDLCTWCYVPQRADPQHAPGVEEQVRFARAGIGGGGAPHFVTLTPGEVEEELGRLARLRAAGSIPRIALAPTPVLGDYLEAGGALPEGTVVQRTGVAMQVEQGPTWALERQVAGELHGPPMEPDLLARVAAAADEHGVVHDAQLANEYFEAMVAQGEALRVRLSDQS